MIGRGFRRSTSQDGLKALENCLSSQDVLALLDRSTALLRRDEKLTGEAGNAAFGTRLVVPHEARPLSQTCKEACTQARIDCRSDLAGAL